MGGIPAVSSGWSGRSQVCDLLPAWVIPVGSSSRRSPVRGGGLGGDPGLADGPTGLWLAPPQADTELGMQWAKHQVEAGIASLVECSSAKGTRVHSSWIGLLFSKKVSSPSHLDQGVQVPFGWRGLGFQGAASWTNPGFGLSKGSLDEPYLRSPVGVFFVGES